MAKLINLHQLVFLIVVSITMILVSGSAVAGDGFNIEEAKWDSEKSLLKVKGTGRQGLTVKLMYASDHSLIAEKVIRKEEWRFRETDLHPVPCTVRVEQSDGAVQEKSVKDAPEDCDAGINDDDTNIPPVNGDFTVLAANDLGMHCADLDYQVFSILPPYNVLHAQVLKRGSEPEFMTPADGIGVTYKAVNSNIFDLNEPDLPPIAMDSINSTSENDLANGIYKGNFWEPMNGLFDELFGFLSYDNLYPPGVLAAFPLRELIEGGILGLPAPDLERLYLGDGMLAADQSTMPGILAPFEANDPQPFHGYVTDLPFFVSFPEFGYVVEGFNRYTAEGIPLMPIDDAGRSNAYPLMRVEAHDLDGNVLAGVDTVLPVASESDCQGCHLEQEVCTSFSVGITCGDIANFYDRGAELITEMNLNTSNPLDAHFVPGDTSEQIVINAAKINILRVHDAKNGTTLDAERNIVCANCHYSPALDLAHLGPSDLNGKEQTRHQSMSRVMHSYHASLPDNNANDPDGAFDDLFPVMPMITERTGEQTQDILEQTCYSCHPGKRTKCLRGAMGDAGMVCQDCHGQGTQVGNDFTEEFPNIAFPGPGSADLSKRVSWASEPKCQSCHLGDVLQVQQMHDAGELSDVLISNTDNAGNPDGLRLQMAYRVSDHKTSETGGTLNLPLLDFADSRFASDYPLYRLSGANEEKGHGGVFCESCHGSTHAIWPNGNPFANDNKTAMDLQGHTGAVTECSTCHTGEMDINLDGPHGLHPVGASKFAKEHGGFAEKNLQQCRACHGQNGEGSVLSRTAVERVLQTDGDGSITIPKGQPVGCGECHENELMAGGVED